jgi:hypothetical protein
MVTGPTNEVALLGTQELALLCLSSKTDRRCACGR